MLNIKVLSVLAINPYESNILLVFSFATFFDKGSWIDGNSSFSFNKVSLFFMYRIKYN